MAKASSHGTKHGSEVAALALVPPPAFVAARNTLAKELKAAGDAKTAAELAKRKRPSWTTWALATIANDDAAVVDAVFDAGATLQHAALSGGDVRAAQTKYSTALEKATKAALGALAEAGQHAPAATQIRDLRSALRAAVLEGAGSRARLVAGTFSAAEDEEVGTFGSTDAPSPKATHAPISTARDDGAKKRAAREAEIAREAAAKKQAAHVAKVAKLRAAAKEATRALEEAEDDVRSKTRALHDATKARDAAKTSADAAQAALDDEA